MVAVCWLPALVLFPVAAWAQYAPPADSAAQLYASAANTHLLLHHFAAPRREYAALGKLYQRNYGAQLGFQRGQFSFLEMGAEYHWRKISLTKPTMISVGGSFGYSFWDNLAEYKVGAWYKWGRVALTYGGNLVYVTNFEKGRIGVAPVVGFRLLGFHLTTGYNFLSGDEEFKRYNNFYVSLRYFFQSDNKFTWRRNRKKNKDKKGIHWPWKKE